MLEISSWIIMSAIVVAGGTSRRFGQNKGLVTLGEKPLIIHVLDRLAAIADEIIVVVSSVAQERRFAFTVGGRARIIKDNMKAQTPLAGAQAGFKAVHSDHALLLACDTPFLSRQGLGLLLKNSRKGFAAIPRWPNGNIEPLHAAYNAHLAMQATERALELGKLDMRSMIANLTNIHYVPIAAFREFDPKLITFFNVNTPNDLNEAERVMKRFTRSTNHQHTKTSVEDPW
jgi:molybdopterin-guanine dinucleotide biosynthesis protein A